MKIEVINDSFLKDAKACNPAWVGLLDGNHNIVSELRDVWLISGENNLSIYWPKVPSFTPIMAGLYRDRNGKSYIGFSKILNPQNFADGDSVTLRWKIYNNGW